MLPALPKGTSCGEQRSEGRQAGRTTLVGTRSNGMVSKNGNDFGFREARMVAYLDIASDRIWHFITDPCVSDIKSIITFLPSDRCANAGPAPLSRQESPEPAPGVCWTKAAESVTHCRDQAPGQLNDVNLHVTPGSVQ